MHGWVQVASARQSKSEKEREHASTQLTEREKEIEKLLTERNALLWHKNKLLKSLQDCKEELRKATDRVAELEKKEKTHGSVSISQVSVCLFAWWLLLLCVPS